MALTAQLLSTWTLSHDLIGIAFAPSIAPSSSNYIAKIRHHETSTGQYYADLYARANNNWDSSGWTYYPNSLSPLGPTHAAFTGALNNGSSPDIFSAYWITYNAIMNNAYYAVLYTNRLNQPSTGYITILSATYTTIWHTSGGGPYCFICLKNPSSGTYWYYIMRWRTSETYPTVVTSYSSPSPIEHKEIGPQISMSGNYAIAKYNSGTSVSYTTYDWNGNYISDNTVEVLPFTPYNEKIAFWGHRSTNYTFAYFWSVMLWSGYLRVYRHPGVTWVHTYDDMLFGGINLQKLSFCNSYPLTSDKNCYILIVEQASDGVQVHAAIAGVGYCSTWEKPQTILKLSGTFAFFWADQERPVFFIATYDSRDKCMCYYFYEIVYETPGDPGGPGTGVGKSGSLLYNAVNG